LADSRPTPGEKGRRFWLTIGEVAAVAAVVIASMNYWEAHRQHAAEQQHASAEERAQAAFVLTGSADARGRIVALQPVKTSQVIQSQTYLFPGDVLGHPQEVTAAKPGIDAEWISGGLGRALDQAGARGAGQAELPVGVVTTYVEDGESRTDRSIYQVGWAWRSRFLAGRKITLQGVSLLRRAAAGDLQAEVNRRWAASRAGWSQAKPPES
jgi:hypothetical protein